MLIYFAKNIKATYNPSTEGMVQQCHECLRYKNNGQWVDRPPPGTNLEAIKEENRLSYVVCDDCFPSYWEKILEQNAEYDKTHSKPN